MNNTLKAMREGYEIIFQATLTDQNLIGHADFLRKVPRASALGDWSYEVLDTKLARSEKAKFIIQLGFYSALVAKVQGIAPLQMHVVLGDRSEVAYRCAEYSRYLSLVNRQFQDRITGAAQETYPVPCEKCDLCKWNGLCEERRLKDDHLCQVANISRIQIKKLESNGVSTLEALGTLLPEVRIPKMTIETQERLHRQARLQLIARQTGMNQLELLAQDAEAARGFARLPRPHSDDLFFDMEGNPLEEGGLEYLFGLYYFQDGKPVFKAFWGHNRAEEKLAFEDFMDFVTGWLPAWMVRKTPSQVISTIDELLDTHSEVEVTAILNERGHRTYRQMPYTIDRVVWLRTTYKLKSRRQRLEEQGFSDTEQLRQRLQVSQSTIRLWRQAGLLPRKYYGDGTRCLYGAPENSDLLKAQLRRVAHVKDPDQLQKSE